MAAANVSTLVSISVILTHPTCMNLCKKFENGTYVSTFSNSSQISIKGNFN